MTQRLQEVARAAEAKRGAGSSGSESELSKLQQSRANLMAKVSSALLACSSPIDVLLFSI